MKIGIITRTNDQKWGGDLTALYSIYDGLKTIGEDVIIGRTVEEVLQADFIFLSNTSFDLTGDYQTVKKHGKRYGVIGFHSDRPKYYSPCYGFANFVGLCLEQGRNFYSLEQLFENPDIVEFFSYAPPPMFEENYAILNEAEICIATSPTEAATVRRDSPECRAEVVYLDCGIPDSYVGQKNHSFLEWSGLKEGEYVLQVGRIELRKNQLASVLALRDLDMPLVLIATESFYPAYEKICLEAIKKLRKAPTFVISQNLPSEKRGSLHILQMPHAQKLPLEMLVSAYQNAGLLLHPAFCELPGLTYLESAKLGVPTVASEWTTIKDYFTDPITQEYTLDDRIIYTPPHHINILTDQIKKHFGKKVDTRFAHPIFQRTKADVAADFMRVI